MNENELAAQEAKEPEAPPPTSMRYSIDEMVRQRKWLKDLKEQLMEDELHYGTIRGRGDKPTLLQPGADLINTGLKVYPDFEVMHSIRDAESKEIAYGIKCSLVHKVSREIMATGVGSCSSRERKYSKQSPTEVENTVLKMAAKRAKVCATLNVVGASDLFTQDIEDMPAEAFQGRGAGPARRPQPQQTRQAPRGENGYDDFLG